MGTDKRLPTGALIDRLAAEPYRFDFYQAVSLLEQASPGHRPVGHDGHQAEAVRFRSHVSLGFPPSDVVAVDPTDDEHRPTLLTTAIMGLAGAQGPLPPPITDTLLRRNAAREYATRDLLDIFNHRALSFLYRARHKHRIALSRVPPDSSAFAGCLRVIAGRTIKRPRQDQHRWQRPLLRYTGMLAGAPRSLAGLVTLLSDYFGIHISGEQLVGAWLPVDPTEWTHLGQASGSRNALGRTTMLGTRAWDQRAGIRLRIHNLSRERLSAFLPGGPDFEAITQLTRRFLQESFAIELYLEPVSSAHQPMALGRAGNARLGWTSRLPGMRDMTAPVRLHLPMDI